MISIADWLNHKSIVPCDGWLSGTDCPLADQVDRTCKSWLAAGRTKHWNAAFNRSPKPAGYRGVPMLRKDAEREIIREWMNLPETERQSEHQAARFALKMKRKYPFDYAGGDRYHEIRRMMLRHHKGVLDSLK